MFESVIHHYVCVCLSASYPDTNLMRHGFVGIETRNRLLASLILVNTLLYLTSVSDCHWTWTWCPHYPNHLTSIFFIFLNLLSFCLHPHPPTTHTTKIHTPKPEIPVTVCHIVLIFVICLWYKTIFPTEEITCLMP